MSVKGEIGKVLAGSVARTSKNLVKEMIQLPSLNMRYNLVNRADRAMLNGVHKALSMPSNLIGEAKNIAYEARKNKNLNDINYNNNNSYNLNNMLQQSQIQSHAPLYHQSNYSDDIGLAERYASLEIASNARRNLYNNFKR